MTKEEFKAARLKLGLTQEQISLDLGEKDKTRYAIRTVASWELGEREVPPAVGKLVKLMLMANG